MADRVRVDKWLWAVRVYRTRTAANEACMTGRIRINGEPAKPASRVDVGDRVTARTASGMRDLEVVQLLERRVGTGLAAAAVIDHTPAPQHDTTLSAEQLDTPGPGRRQRGAGRPTKRDRRRIDAFREDGGSPR